MAGANEAGRRMNGRRECDCCRRLMAMLSRDHMAEKIAIWHPGHGFPDQVQINLMADGMDTITGAGETLCDAIGDLEKKLQEAGT